MQLVMCKKWNVSFLIVFIVCTISQSFNLNVSAETPPNQQSPEIKEVSKNKAPKKDLGPNPGDDGKKPKIGDETLGKEMQNETKEERLLWISHTKWFLIFLLGLLFSYLFWVHRNYYQACFRTDHPKEKWENDENPLEIFAKSPAGLPVGTVRSILALLLVSVSLYFLIMTTFRQVEFPEALTAVLSAVLGFYFGSRSSEKSKEKAPVDAAAKAKELALKQKVQESEAARDKAQAEKAGQESESLLKKIAKGIALSKTTIGLMPEPSRGEYKDVISQLEKGKEEVQALYQNDKSAEAMKKAKEVFALFEVENPLRKFVEKAQESFAGILGGELAPPIFLDTLVALKTKLDVNVYSRWRTRVLRLPVSIGDFKLDQEGKALLIKGDSFFNKIFTQELEEKSVGALSTTVDSLLGATTEKEVDEVWVTLQKKSEMQSVSRDQFEKALSTLRLRMIDQDLQKHFSSELLSKVGGYERFMNLIDKVFVDSTGQSNLQFLFVLFEGIQKSGESVGIVFGKVFQELQEP